MVVAGHPVDVGEVVRDGELGPPVAVEIACGEEAAELGAAVGRHVGDPAADRALGDAAPAVGAGGDALEDEHGAVGRAAGGGAGVVGAGREIAGAIAVEVADRERVAEPHVR